MRGSHDDARRTRRLIIAAAHRADNALDDIALVTQRRVAVFVAATWLAELQTTSATRRRCVGIRGHGRGADHPPDVPYFIATEQFYLDRIGATLTLRRDRWRRHRLRSARIVAACLHDRR